MTAKRRGLAAELNNNEREKVTSSTAQTAIVGPSLLQVIVIRHDYRA